MLNSNDYMNDRHNMDYMNSCECPNMVSNVMDLDCECKDKQRREMMHEIRSLNFAIIELGLYLDTHPEDEKALCLHREYTKELKELKDQYQRMFGPLTIYYPCKKWRWLEEPWPWERGDF